MNGAGVKRGAFIVFEGCDKSGKSTHCKKLVEKLWELGVTAQLLRFPDRATATGRIINNYLANKEELPDQAIHLLFSANRWESEPKLKQLIYEGVTLVVDRYSFSGVAYSAAKPSMDFEWCKKPELGLPKPDLVFLLNVSSDTISRRAQFGTERYENDQFQVTAYKNFQKMMDDSWKVIDGEKDIEVVHEELMLHATEAIQRAQTRELDTLW